MNKLIMLILLKSSTNSDIDIYHKLNCKVLRTRKYFNCDRRQNEELGKKERVKVGNLEH